MTVVTFDPVKDKSYAATRLGRDVADFLAWMELGGSSPRTLGEHRRVVPSGDIGSVSDRSERTAERHTVTITATRYKGETWAVRATFADGSWEHHRGLVVDGLGRAFFEGYADSGLSAGEQPERASQPEQSVALSPETREGESLPPAAPSASPRSPAEKPLFADGSWEHHLALVDYGHAADVAARIVCRAEDKAARGVPS